MNAAPQTTRPAAAAIPLTYCRCEDGCQACEGTRICKADSPTAEDAENVVNDFLAGRASWQFTARALAYDLAQRDDGCWYGWEKRELTDAQRAEVETIAGLFGWTVES